MKDCQTDLSLKHVHLIAAKIGYQLAFCEHHEKMKCQCYEVALEQKRKKVN